MADSGMFSKKKSSEKNSFGAHEETPSTPLNCPQDRLLVNVLNKKEF